MARKIFTTKINNKELKVTIGDLSVQAEASALVQYGETVVLATVCSASPREGTDFFPLTVDYEEKYYAAGEILGSRYMRREGRPSDQAILTARLIDRAIRPRFPEGFRQEVQVVTTVLSFDNENDPCFPALLGTSLVLSLSSLPWQGPLGIAFLSKTEGHWIPFPSYKEKEVAQAVLSLTGVKEKGDWLINMIETDAKEIPEDALFQGMEEAKKTFQEIFDFQEKIIKAFSPTKIKFTPPSLPAATQKDLEKFITQNIEKYLFGFQGLEAKTKQKEFQELYDNFVEEHYPEDKDLAETFLAEKIREIVHQKALEGIRMDGRKLDEIRPLSIELGLTPRTHGSGLFSRGLTKVLTILTLGSPADRRKVEGMEVVEEKRYMHQYNMPPYASGEVAPHRGPKRREIGHGYLAEKALIPVLPSFEDFPYTIRLVSEVLSSNGSTSMGATCASTLALMDGGVPISAPVAGISIGLMQVGKDYRLLTDIRGWEDKEGDMDFKVTGTRKGITAIQLDVKISGLTYQIVRETLEKAKQARLQILDLIEKTLPKPRPQLSPYAPKIVSGKIDPERIGFIIGSGGKNIRKLSEKYQATIDIEDSGQVYVTAPSFAEAKKALKEILAEGKEIKIGDVFQAKVKKITDFGAFVEFRPGQEGLVHISQFVPQRINHLDKIIHIGEVIPVKVIEIDQEGRYNLSAKAAGFRIKKKTL